MGGKGRSAEDGWDRAGWGLKKRRETCNRVENVRDLPGSRSLAMMALVGRVSGEVVQKVTERLS